MKEEARNKRVGEWYYYWRQYGNNYPVLCQIDSKEYFKNTLNSNECFKYCGGVTGAVNQGYYFYNIFGEQCFHWHTFKHPLLKYSANTYWYGYFKSCDISHDGKFSAENPKDLILN